MTTIAYKNGELAFDSLVTAGNDVIGYTKKGFKIGPYIFAGCGNPEFLQEFTDWVRADFKEESAPCLAVTSEISSEIFLVHSDNRNQVVRYTEHLIPIVYEKLRGGHGFATGSGANYALGAMAAGASAQQSCIIAAKYDLGTGGRIRVLRF